MNTTPLPGNTAPSIQSLGSFASATSVAAVPASAGVTLPILTPPAGIAAGTSASISLAAQSAGGVNAAASALMSTSQPGGPTLSSIARLPEGTRSAQNESASISGILFFSFTVSAASPPTSFTFASAPTFTITLPSAFFGVPSTSFYLAVYDPTRPTLGWQSRSEVCAATATTATLVCNAPPPGGPVTIQNNVTYIIALYAVSARAPSPTPAPSVTPTSIATNAPPSASNTVTLTTGATVTLPSVAGAGGTITLGTVSASTSVAVTTYLQVPPGLPNPGTTFAAPFYVTLKPATTVTISGSSSAVMIPPTTWVGPQSDNACPFMEMYDTSSTHGWFLKAIAGVCNTNKTGTPSPNNSAEFSTTQSMTLTGGVTYAFAPYPSN